MRVQRELPRNTGEMVHMEYTSSERMLDLLEEERRRLAREIHDGPAQSLTNVTMRLEIIKKLLDSDRSEDALRELSRLQTLMRGAINDVRRLIFDLRPSSLERGLQQGIPLYAERFSQMSGIPVHLHGAWDEARFPRAVEIALFRVFQEALHNVYKHARANEVRVGLESTPDVYRLSIADDGAGFIVRETSTGSYGLLGMRERMGLIQGWMNVTSKPGEGTLVVCEVPRVHE